ncbi:MAG: hypothetical protein IIV99_06255 [Oscillospiraceae bacterium]|nr:hypothetical protein [Oscillospiraceae bacterium]
MKKRLAAILAAVVVAFTMTVTAFAGTGSAKITLSISQNQKFYSTKAMLTEYEVPYFDLALYGLQDYYYNPECYTAEEQKAGTKATAKNNVTMLHALIYITEILQFGVSPGEAGMGLLYESGELANYIPLSGAAGSSYITSFWGWGSDLNYYVNYAFPLGKDGWGATSDQILLKDGDHLSIHQFDNPKWNITGSTFARITANGSSTSASADKGDKVKFTLEYTTSQYGAETGYVKEDGVTLYYTSKLSTDPAKWTKIGKTNSQGQVTLDTSKLSAGTYYIGTDSSEAFVADARSHAPGIIKLTVKDTASVTYGDVNADGKINSTDASLVLRYATSGVSITTDAADVNGDGKINSTDASLILRYSSGKITKFPVE